MKAQSSQSLFNEFKTFAMRGNVVDLAVAVVIGTAFSKIVSSLVDNIIAPLIGVLTGGAEFSRLAVSVGNAEIQYGAFIQSVVDFLIIALSIFAAVKLMNRLHFKEEKKEEAKPKEPPEEVVLLREIRDALQK